MKTLHTAAIIIITICGLTNCKHRENIVEPAEGEIINSIVDLKDSQILIYGENISVYG